MSKSDSQKLPLVEVTWIDSMGYDGWRQQDAAHSQLADKKVLWQKSAGYIFEQTSEFTAIAQSYNFRKDGCIGNIMQIPNVAIKHMRYIGKKGKK